jgi:hypothetical protein
MNFRSSELTSGRLFPRHRPSTAVGMPERCSPARIRFAALTRVLACSAPFRQISTCDGRLRREHLLDSGSYQWLTRKMLTRAGLLMEVARYPPEGIRSNFPLPGLRDGSHRSATKRMRMIGSFIIHYLPWQARR